MRVVARVPALSKVVFLALILALVCLACTPDAAPRDTGSSMTSLPGNPSTTGRSSTTSEPGEASATTMASVEPATTTAPSTSAPKAIEVLIYHETQGFRHESIPEGIAAIHSVAGDVGARIEVTDDSSVFTPERLARFDAVIFLNTTGDVLDAGEEAAMEEAVGLGLGFVGIHSAADTEYDWPAYGALLGAYFANHPRPQSALVEFSNIDHPVIEGLPAEIEIFDEWYNFRSMPSGKTILGTVDETTYSGGNMGSDHPIVWADESGDSRSVYIGMGHVPEVFSLPEMRLLLRNAIAWTGSAR